MPKTLEEQIRELVEQNTVGDPADPTKTKDTSQPVDPGEVSVRAADGSVITGANYEEVARKLAARAPRAEPEPEPEPKGTRPKYNTEKFVESFVKDPAEGLRYFEDTVYGFRPDIVVPQMAQALQTLITNQLEREAETFIEASPDYKPGEANEAVLNRYVAEYGLPRSAKGYKKAWALAKLDGAAETKPEPKPRTGMPHGRSVAVGSEPDGGYDPGDLAGLSDDVLERLMDNNRDALKQALRGENF